MADMKTAAYVCKGCGIGERVDTAQMAKIATKEGKMHLVREHDFLCSAAGVQAITDDIEKEGVTHVVIAACSRRAKTEAFHFPGVALARANIREGVIWARPDTEDARETTQEMADDYVRMGCGELKKMKLPAGNPDTGHAKRLLVVGGGISGLTAALEASKTGYRVVLVEKSGKLGGWAGELYRRMPFREPYAEPQDTGMAELIKAIEGDANIKVITNAVIAKTDGAPGRFKVDISVESGPSLTEEVGAIIQEAMRRLAPEGRVVVTAVILETLETARTVLEQAGWEVEVVQVQVSRSYPLAGGTALQALNPVWVITGWLRGGPGERSSQ